MILDIVCTYAMKCTTFVFDRAHRWVSAHVKYVIMLKIIYSEI